MILGINKNASIARITPTIVSKSTVSFQPKVFTDLAIGNPPQSAPNVPIMLVMPAKIAKYFLGNKEDAICKLAIKAHAADRKSVV